jgi:predicted TIM-barrel fold metal-dependent hydrolase
VGFPSYYLEFHPAYSILYWTHLASLIFGGVFEKYPNFKLVLVEGGFSWIVPFMWRMDRHWERFRREVPAAKRPPSEYVYESVRLTTQPLEEPRAVADFQKLCDIGHADKLLLFATDYPHWDFDSPEWVKTRLPRVQRDAIMYRNALELYGLPAYRQA